VYARECKAVVEGKIECERFPPALAQRGSQPRIGSARRVSRQVTSIERLRMREPRCAPRCTRDAWQQARYRGYLVDTTGASLR